MSEARLLGTGTGMPEKIVTNDDLAAMMDTSDAWIRTRTGIGSRRIVTKETLTSLSAAAAVRAMEAAGICAKQLDMIIVATLTPDSPLPNASCTLQKVLGAENAVCFDLSAACSGFLFALNTAAMYIRCDAANYVLVVGAEVLSKIVNWEERGSCILFGDGAGAAILGADSRPGFLGSVLGSDGSRGQVLTLHDRAIENPFKKKWEKEKGCASEGMRPEDRYVYMDGSEVFKFAVRQVPECIRQVLEKVHLEAIDIDHFVLHQANRRIIEAVAKRLHVDIERFYMNIEQYGNTSAASIPIALDELMRSGRVKAGDRMVISGFGGGLTWGALALQV